jgi:GAF domain-containing protein
MTSRTNSVAQTQRPAQIFDHSYFPFPTELNLKYAIDFWRKYAASNPAFRETFAERFEAILKEHPFLLQPIEDAENLRGMEEFLELLFGPVLPKEGWSTALLVASPPFVMTPAIVATGNFYKLLDAGNVHWEILDSPPDQESLNCRTIGAYAAILHKYYKTELPFDFPIVVVYMDKETGLSRYFKGTGLHNFIGLQKLAPVPKLSKEELQQLSEQPFDFEVWRKLLPPENFLFSGVNFFSMLDVTTEEASARLQRILLEKCDMDEAGQFQSLQRELRNFFKLPHLRLGLATLQSNGELNFNSNRPFWNSLALRDIPLASMDWVRGSLYEKVLQTGKQLIVEDLGKKAPNLSRTEQALAEHGCRNLLLVPLLYNEQPVGILEVTSPVPGGIHCLSLLKINHIKPMFAHALNRHRDEFENKVEAAMMERYTAIHPAIQWRFREATIRQLNRQGGKDESIKFEGVFPFFGSLDIRASSQKRNQAVHRDLLDNLGTARHTLQQVYQALSFSVLGELAFRVEQRLKKLQESFNTGDEPAIAEFIRREINPALEHIQRNYPAAAATIEVYFENLSPATGVFNRNRQAYEEALLLINQTIVAVLDEEEAALQNLFPCYFEKYKTDGVEYNIYTGASIAPQREFDPLYLDNIRLRQLSWTCRIMRKVEALQPHFKKLLSDARCTMPDSGCAELPAADGCLEIAPLILAFGNPITLNFRMDEKRLDVDGSYNVRYEIIKKRIDKAVVKGTQERLTLPGHIAIVYAREQEAVAHRSHLEYLAAQQYVQPEWEDLELEALQGVEGLRALRVKI